MTRLKRAKPVVIQKGISGDNDFENTPPTKIETIQLNPPKVAMIP